MPVQSDQERVIKLLRESMRECASRAMLPSGQPMQEAIDKVVDSPAIHRQFIDFAKTPEGAAALEAFARASVHLYLNDLLIRMDQGLTPLGFALKSHASLAPVSTSGIAGYWPSQIEPED